jgi:hypothetical protein
MPNLIDALKMKSGSTEVTVFSTDRVLQNVDVTLTAKTLTGGTITGSTFTSATIGSGVGLTVTSLTTATAALPAYGLALVGSSTAPQAYDLPLPSAAGVELFIHACLNAPTSNCAVTIATTAANLIDGKYQTILMQPYNWVHLIGQSATVGWLIVGQNTTTVGQSTSLITLSS